MKYNTKKVYSNSQLTVQYKGKLVKIRHPRMVDKRELKTINPMSCLKCKTETSQNPYTVVMHHMCKSSLPGNDLLKC